MKQSSTPPTTEIIISKQGRQMEATAQILERARFKGFRPKNFKGEGSKISFKKWKSNDTYKEKGYLFRGASEPNQIRRMLFEATDEGFMRGDLVLLGSDYISNIELLNGTPSQETLLNLGITDPDTTGRMIEELSRTKNGLRRVLDTQLSQCRLAPICKDQAVKSLADFQGKKILTMFPQLAQLWCEANNIQGVEIEYLGKGIDTECADYSGIIGLEIVESGDTARAMGLKILDQDTEAIPSVLQSVTLGLYERQPSIAGNNFRRQIERALNGMNQVSLVFNLPNNVNFEETIIPIIAEKTGWSAERIKRATIKPLANGGTAVEIWIPNNLIDPSPEGNIMDLIEDKGGQGVGAKNLDLMGN